MKVENPHVTLSTPAPAPAAAAADAARPTAIPASPADADAVRLSPSLRLADQAVRAAASASDVRPGVVAKARALLASGELGADLDQLAGRIIDHLTPHDTDIS